MRSKKKKISIKIDNKIPSFGEEKDGKIKINVRKHFSKKARKEDSRIRRSTSPKEELADTVFHETYHAKHPQATEKETYKKTRIAMKEMSYSEKEALTKKLRMKKLNYKSGAIKRKFKMKPGKVEPGVYISKMNESKIQRKTNPAKTSDFKLDVEALI